LRKHLELFKTSIYCPELMARFQPMSAAPASKHGFSPSFSVKDEVHAWADGELAQIIRDGMAARAQPLDWILTTAGIKGWGYGWEVHDRAAKILDGTIYDPTFLPVIFAADADDDWMAPASWTKANPNLGISPRLDFIEEQCRQARESPRLENNFRRYHLNQWTEQVTRWLSLEAWDACAGSVHWDRMAKAFEGRRCFVGLDLSAKIDLTAAVLVFPPPAPGGCWAVIPRFYMPAERVDERMKRDRLPYVEWCRAGAITATPGNVVDYGYIEQQLYQDARQFKIEECAFDPWNATQTALRLQDQGLTMVEFGQGYKSMSEPTKEFERLVTAGLLMHGGHPVLREMAKAVSVATDPAGNIKPDKSRASLRIDGVVAAIMGMGRGMVSVNKHLAYADRGLLVLA
jgi:phage terminase large subunit-like protein